MKKLVSILILYLSLFGTLTAQNIWKPINIPGTFKGVAANGDLFIGQTGIQRSQDEGETWQIVLEGTSYNAFDGFTISPDGRIFDLPYNQNHLCISDDGGDTWRNSPDFLYTSLENAPMYAVSDDTLFLYQAEGDTLLWTLDGGNTWDKTCLSFLDHDPNYMGPWFGTMLADEAGNVYIGTWGWAPPESGVFQANLDNMNDWSLIISDSYVQSLVFDIEGNIVIDCPAVANNGIFFSTQRIDGDYMVLTYSTDHGVNYTPIGEGLPSTQTVPETGLRLFKGGNQHLYCHGDVWDGGTITDVQYYKSIRKADYILENFPLENTAWVQFYRSMYEDSTYYQLGIKGDTLVNETTYKKVINCAHLGYPIEGECFGGIREDADGKCYFMSFVPGIYAPWPLHYDCEVNIEYPLYDFSLLVCDVFQTNGGTPNVVFDTDEMELNGSTRKVLWFGNNCDNGNYYDYQWIEGIGSTHSLLYPIQWEPDNGPEYRLVEVWQDEEMIYRNPHFEDYVPMIKEGNQRQKWNVVYMASMNYPNDYFTEIQSIRDDITLDGVDYKLVWKEDVYDSKRIAGAVREEDRRVYYRRKLSQSYEEEVLLYDFNLTVGDTVAVGWSDYQLIVLEESEIEVNGTMRRQLGLAEYFAGSTNYEVEEYWIEGVGSTYGFLNSGYEGWVGAFVHLLCYHENGNLIWDNEAFDECVMNSDGAPATFAPQGAEWYFDVFNPWGTHPEYERFYVDGDTVIQGHQCSIIDQHFLDTGHEGGEFVYEEDNKVYWFNPTTNAFTTLYDFDAEAGESWDYEVGDCTHQVIVDSVGSVTWNGHTYRTQWVRFNEDVQYYSGKIIEGIGYEKGLFPSIAVCNGWEVFDASEIEYLRCYVNDGEMLYHEGGYDCEQTTVTPPSHPEWYYEILNENGTITYQYMYQAGDTIINDEPTHILVKINTLYDKGLLEEVTHEYVFELNGKLYWWNKRTHSFTVLYDYEAEVGDSWDIMVGIEPPLTMTVDAVDYVEYEGRTYRVMHVSDPDDLFSGDIVCGIGHLTSLFPERLMRNSDGFRVEGLRCYWVEDELVFNLDGEEECDAVYSEVHGIEEGGPSTPSTGSGTFTIYPNPTNGVLFVETVCTPSLPAETYRITNLMGQTLMTGNITAETMQIDVSNLPEGMYFITVGDATRKFVVR